MKDSSVLAGKIFGVHGIRGAVKMKSFVEDNLMAPGNHILVISPGQIKKQFIIQKIQPHKKVFLVYLNDITSRNQAEELIGSQVFINSSLLPELEEDTYFWSDLIGLKVFDSQKGFLGEVYTILETGSNDVYVVHHNNQEILIPAIKPVIQEININTASIHVQLPEGLEYGPI